MFEPGRTDGVCDSGPRRASPGRSRGRRAGGGRRRAARAARRGGHGRADGRVGTGNAGRRAAGNAPGAWRDARGACRLRARDARSGGARGGAGRGDRPVRNRSRRRRHLQHLDPGRIRRRGCRGAGRQARKPGGHQPMRLRRHHRGTRNRARSGARCGRAAHRRDRLRLHLRAVLPPGHEARHADSARAPDAHRVQPARPDQLAGRRSAPAAGRCGGTAVATPRRRAGASRHGPRTGGALGRWARRAVVGRPESGHAGRGPDGRGDRDRPGRAWACGARRGAHSSAAMLSSTARSP